MENILIDSTLRTLSLISNDRFFANERGYQATLHSILRQILTEVGTVNDSRILESEYQKSVRHHTDQRPDIILHIPATREVAVTENNYAVWALKRRAYRRGALEDFEKLDEMFETLHYQIGFFINIDSVHTQLSHYHGGFKERVMGCSTKKVESSLVVTFARWANNEVVDRQDTYNLGIGIDADR